jgi:phenylacetate-CoA ligase
MYTTETAFYPLDKITSLQESKLHELLKYVNEHSPFYKELFLVNKIDVSKIKSLKDLSKIPTTSKEDIQKRNWDFLCVERGKIAEFTATSGTLGNPVTIALTENDLDRLAYNEYGSFLCADGTSSDIYQLMLTLDRQFMAGMAYYTGLRRLGAGIIRTGPGIPGLQWESIRRYNPTAIVGVPSQILKLIEYTNEHNFDINSCSVQKAICIGENIRSEDLSLNILGQRITSAWNIKLYSTYASTEMQTAFTECGEGMGCHHQPELIIVELLDDNGDSVQDGEIGEVTITTLGVEAMPLMRYRTGDMCRAFTSQCKCGRNSLRLSPVIGRKKQLIKLKGTTIYPPALFDILNGLEDVEDFVTEVFSNELNNDEVMIYVVVKNSSNDFDKQIKSNLQAKLRVIPLIKYVTKEELGKMQNAEMNRKGVRFIDRRVK